MKSIIRSAILLTTACLLMVGCDGLSAGNGKSASGKNSNRNSINSMDFRKVVRESKAKVFPAVVFIKCLSESHEMGRKTSQEVLGSGVVISPDGQVLSNWHVVDKAKQINCLLSDGTYYKAKIIGTDKDTDLALLQLIFPEDKPKPVLPHAKLGNSRKLQEGDFVMAMGAPYGLNRSVSIGIISCTRRYLPGTSEYSLWLQTDASINPGNSGGPLVDTNGEIIGINTRGGSGMGFATPSHNIRIIVNQLRKYNKVNWSWTGIRLQPLKNFRQNMYFKGSEGVIVADTDPRSPAQKAGLLKKDRILAINDKPITALWEEDLPRVRRTLGLLDKNKPAKLTIMRDSKKITIMMTPREKGKVEGDELDCPRWDMTFKTINQFDNEGLYFYRKKGVFVFGVEGGHNASNSGFEPEDILLSIEGKEIRTLKDVKAAYDSAMKNIDKKHRIVFKILRGGVLRIVVLDFQRDWDKE